jgi:hypothetical protein
MACGYVLMFVEDNREPVRKKVKPIQINVVIDEE